MKRYYYIDEHNDGYFETLREVRDHVRGFLRSERDRKSFQGCMVCRVNGDESDPNFARTIDVKGNNVILRKD
jgi:hypothetical protein